jgi:hypothetical protein
MALWEKVRIKNLPQPPRFETAYSADGLVLTFRVRHPEMAEAVSDATAADAVADLRRASADYVVTPGADESGQNCRVDPFFHNGVALRTNQSRSLVSVSAIGP